MVRVLALAALSMLSFLSAACGIAFSSDSGGGNDFFEYVFIGGDLTAGAPLFLDVAYEQSYPFELTVRCDQLRGTETLRTLGEGAVAAHPDGRPGVTPVAGKLSFQFTIDEPGAYRIDCYTPLDEDNFIRKQITITPASR